MRVYFDVDLLMESLVRPHAIQYNLDGCISQMPLG